MDTKEVVAERLAAIHYAIEEGMHAIYRLRANADAEHQAEEPIKLLEINEYTVPAGIMPLQFGPLPASGIHYPTVIVEITPEEFTQVKARELALPNNWTLGEMLPRESKNGSK